MITIICEEKQLAKFEEFESNKAMDWITQKGLFREKCLYTYPDTLWFCKPLPKD